MSDPIEDAFYDKLAGDGTLTAQLSSYPTSPPVPAIFFSREVPENAVMPYLVAEGLASDRNDDSLTDKHRDIEKEIHCYAINDGDPSVIDSIANRVRVLFHDQPLTIAGFSMEGVTAIGPLAGPTSDEYHRVVSIRVRMTAV